MSTSRYKTRNSINQLQGYICLFYNFYYRIDCSKYEFENLITELIQTDAELDNHINPDSSSSSVSTVINNLGNSIHIDSDSSSSSVSTVEDTSRNPFYSGQPTTQLTYTPTSPVYSPSPTSSVQPGHSFTPPGNSSTQPVYSFTPPGYSSTRSVYSHKSPVYSPTPTGYSHTQTVSSPPLYDNSSTLSLPSNSHNPPLPSNSFTPPLLLVRSPRSSGLTTFPPSPYITTSPSPLSTGISPTLPMSDNSLTPPLPVDSLNLTTQGNTHTSFLLSSFPTSSLSDDSPTLTAQDDSIPPFLGYFPCPAHGESCPPYVKPGSHEANVYCSKRSPVYAPSPPVHLSSSSESSSDTTTYSTHSTSKHCYKFLTKKSYHRVNITARKKVTAHRKVKCWLNENKVKRRKRLNPFERFDKRRQPYWGESHEPIVGKHVSFSALKPKYI